MRHSLGLTRDLTLLMLFRAARSVAAGMIALAFPYLVLRTLRYPAGILGLVYASAAVATAVLGLIFGLLADSWGRKQALIAAGMLLPAGCLLLYVSGALPVIYAGAMLGGFSATGSLMGGGIGGAAQPIQSAFIADLTTPATRTFYFSTFTFASGLFAALGVLASRALDVRQVFLAACFISAAGVALLIPTQARRPAARARSLPSRSVIGKFTITGVLNGFSQGLITPFLIPFFILVYDVPKSRMSTFGFIAGAAGAVALLAAPFLERRWGFVKSIAITRGLGAVLLAIMPHSPALSVALAIYCVTPALRVAALPAQQTAVTELVGSDEVGRALGINQVARLAASSGAMMLTGYLFHTHNIALPFYLYAGIMLANVCLYFRFFGASPGTGSQRSAEG
jgi:MFS family permease